MAQNPGKVAVGLLVLVLVWIGVYWWWTPQRGPRISYASDGSMLAEAGAAVAHEPPSDVPPIKEPPPDSATSESSTVSRYPSASSVPHAPAVIPPSFVEYTIQKGDTLAEISKKFFGTSSHASDIARANPFMDAGKLKAGRTIRVPKDPSNIQGKPNPKYEPPAPIAKERPPAPAPKPDPRTTAPQPVGKPPAASPTEYVVKSGDSLSRIAKAVYGDAHLTDKIYQANRDVMSSPDSLREGQRLRIPPKE